MQTGDNTSGVCVEKRVPVANQAGPVGERFQMGSDATVRDVLGHKAHRGADAFVAVALEVGVHEAPEFGQ